MLYVLYQFSFPEETDLDVMAVFDNETDAIKECDRRNALAKRLESGMRYRLTRHVPNCPDYVGEFFYDPEMDSLQA